MSLTYTSEDLGNGWFRRRDLFRLRMGRYCDKCDSRIPEGDPYYTQDADPHKSTDLCEPCYEARC